MSRATFSYIISWLKGITVQSKEIRSKIRLNVQDFLDPSLLGYFKKVGECQEFAYRYVFTELAIFLPANIYF